MLTFVLFILIGVALAWLLAGMAAAIVFLFQSKLRDRALELHRRAVEQSVSEYVLRAGRRGRPKRSEQAVLAWERTRRQRVLPLAFVAINLAFRGPAAFFRLRELRRSRNEIRLE